MEWTDRIGRRIKLRDLHIALVVTQTGSMLKAAEHLAISQPVVSKVIADLEHALGVRLFDRSRRGVEPTPAGRALFNRGRAAFDELRQGVKEVEFLTDPTAGELRIAATENMVAGLIPAVVDRLSRQYPRIVFHVTQALSAAGQFRELRDRDVELLICRLPKSFPEEDLEVEILLDEPFLVAAAVHNRWSKRRQIQLSELADEPWILPRPESFVGALVAKIFEDGGFRIPSASVVCNSFQMSNALLATGRFIGIYPGSLVRLGAKRLGIKVLPVELPIRSTPVGIVTLKNRLASPLARLFIDCAREIAKSQTVLVDGSSRKRQRMAANA